jgi:peptide/nickel transport system substrate-binding protein
MRLSMRARLARVLGVGALTAALLLPGAASTSAAGAVLRVGTVQDLDAMNPYLTEYYIGWEVFGLNYQGLVNFGLNAEPIGGFAKSWIQDGTTWTFKIDPNLKWSDGQPATSADALWTLQELLKQRAGRGYAGVGYLDLYLEYAGVTDVSAPDAQTLVLKTATPNKQILTSYLPILPKHIWAKRDINTDPNKVPVVGTGPYQAVEWKTGEYVRMVRNPNYLGPKSYQDETYIQFFKDEGAMTEALKSGDIDYARNVTSDQYESLKGQPNIVALESTTAAEANAFTHMVFNTYSKPIEGGGASTTAVQDPAFRDALGYAIDKPALVDKVLGGHGIVGSTIIPPAMSNGFWHLDPPNIRTFSLDVAKQKLDAAQYPLNASGKRLDHEAKPINLKMVVPSSSTTYSQSAEFIAAWWKELGIDVTTQSIDADTVSALQKPPEYDPPGKADFDVIVWNWAGDVDPNSLLKLGTTDSIASGSNDSFFSDPHYDALFVQQGAENDPTKRQAIIYEMQQMLYDKAPYHVLFYDAALSAYRTDRFGGWRLSPEEGGLPFFAYGTAGYDYLTAPGPEPTPTAAATTAASTAPSAGASAAVSAAPTPSGSTDGSTTGSGNNMLLIVGAIVIVVVIVGFFAARSRRSSSAGEEE